MMVTMITKRPAKKQRAELVRCESAENENNRNQQHHSINNTRGGKKKRAEWKLCVRIRHSFHLHFVAASKRLCPQIVLMLQWHFAEFTIDNKTNIKAGIKIYDSIKSWCFKWQKIRDSKYSDTIEIPMPLPFIQCHFDTFAKENWWSLCFDCSESFPQNWIHSMIN